MNATGHTNNGVGHRGELLAAAALPDVFERAQRDLVAFAHQVS